MNHSGTHKKVRVRFAPSPTGYLHIGGLRTALFNWLFARHNNGTFLVRIEDTDRDRYTPEHEKAIVDGLEWSGIMPDEPIARQTDRTDRHTQLVEQLLAEDKAYRCYCSYEELQEKRIRAEENKQTYVYDGSCRELEVPEHYRYQKKHVIRFKVDRNESVVTVHDLIRGDVEIQTDLVDDFIIMRSTGGFTYNFVVVADDHDMEISHVIRGEEHLLNTPKQLFLYEAFGWTAPQFAHLPLILSPNGGKLSKRDGAVSVSEYAKQGVLHDALCNYLVRLGWSHQDQEIFSKEEMIKLFDVAGIGKKGAVFDQQKLAWINGVYIKESSAQDLIVTARQDLQIDLYDRLSDWSQEQIHAVIDLYKDRVETLVQLVDEVTTLYQAPVHYDQESLDEWVTDETKQYLLLIKDMLLGQASFNKKDIFALVKNWCKEQGHKIPVIAQPLRIAMIGQSSGPGIFDIVALLGKEDFTYRLDAFISFLK